MYQSRQPTHKWQIPTKIQVNDFLKLQGPSTIKELQSTIKKSKRAILQSLADMIVLGQIKRTTCRCGQGHIYSIRS